MVCHTAESTVHEMSCPRMVSYCGRQMDLRVGMDGSFAGAINRCRLRRRNHHKRNHKHRPRARHRGTARSTHTPSAPGSRPSHTSASVAARAWAGRGHRRLAMNRYRTREGASRRTESHAIPTHISKHSRLGRTHHGRMRCRSHCRACVPSSCRYLRHSHEPRRFSWMQNRSGIG